MAIYYTQEVVHDLRRIRERVRSVTYFLYDNGKKVKPPHVREVTDAISDAICAIESIKPPLRTGEKFDR